MLSRRSFLATTFAAGAVSMARAQGAAPPPTILRVQRRTIEVNGKSAPVFGISQPDGAFGLITETGTPFRVRLENHIGAPSLIHWHGLKPPWQQDGVAGISAPPVPPGGTADYDFPLPFGGTYWMHSHYGVQEQLLMTAPLIIRDRGGDTGEQDIVIMLNDFSFTPPEEIFEQLRKGGKMAMSKGHASGMDTPRGGAKPDLNDVNYDAFLANLRTLADPQVIRVEPGGRVLLRIINGSSMSNYHIDLSQLEGELTAVDGHAVIPINGHRFPVAAAQRLDIRTAIPPGPGAYPVLTVRASAGRPASFSPRAAERSCAFRSWRRRRRRP